MAKPREVDTSGLDEREIAIFDSAEMFQLEALAKGRWQRNYYRTFAEAHAAASMSPDPKARILAVSANGEKVLIERSDWARWMQHLS